MEIKTIVITLGVYRNGRYRTKEGTFTNGGTQQGTVYVGTGYAIPYVVSHQARQDTEGGREGGAESLTHNSTRS